MRRGHSRITDLGFVVVAGLAIATAGCSSNLVMGPINDGSLGARDGGSADLVGVNQAPPYLVTTDSTVVGNGTLKSFVPTLPAGQTAPLVLFKHGYQLKTSNYSALCQAIAEQGLVVIGVDTDSGGLFGGGLTNAQERDATIAALSWAKTTASFAALIDPAHIAVMGHSRGGKVALMVAASDVRITAALLLDPVNGCGPGQPYSSDCPDVTAASIAGALTIPVGVMGETNNASGGLMPCAPAAQNYATVYAALAKASWKVQWTLTGADHMDFTDDGGGAVGALCTKGPGVDAQVRGEVRALATAFARRHLRNDTSVDPSLTGALVPSDITVLGP